jgi:hypothetical protein
MLTHFKSILPLADVQTSNAFFLVKSSFDRSSLQWTNKEQSAQQCSSAKAPE